MKNNINTRIESELEIKAYLQNVRFAIDNGARVNFQADRRVDNNRDERFTNLYTLNTLFPGDSPVDALKRGLLSLEAENYIGTVKDIRFPQKSEMREFGKIYNESEDVYIKLRVELLGTYGETLLFIMSFHFAEKAFTEEMFPYKKK